MGPHATACAQCPTRSHCMPFAFTPPSHAHTHSSTQGPGARARAVAPRGRLLLHDRDQPVLLPPPAAARAGARRRDARARDRAQRAHVQVRRRAAPAESVLGRLVSPYDLNVPCTCRGAAHAGHMIWPCNPYQLASNSLSRSALLNVCLKCNELDLALDIYHQVSFHNYSQKISAVLGLVLRCCKFVSTLPASLANTELPTRHSPRCCPRAAPPTW